MQPKHAIAMLTAAMTHVATAAFNESCAWWMLSGQVSLTGYCVADQTTTSSSSINTPRHWAVSTLDLNHCIGVDPTANAMVWQADGNAFKTICWNCGMQSSQVIMQCECVNIATGGKTSSSVDLNDRIYTDEQGHLTC